MLWSLFIVFFRIGLISFGGGYAMIPILRHDAITRGWMNEETFANAVVLAGMAPGPIAANAATLIGYQAAGPFGAAAAVAGVVMPSIIVILLLASLLFKFRSSRVVRYIFYGLRPVITALILIAAVQLFWRRDAAGMLSWNTAFTVIIIAAVLIGILKYKLHPVLMLVLSGMLGIVFFS